MPAMRKINSELGLRSPQSMRPMCAVVVGAVFAFGAISKTLAPTPPLEALGFLVGEHAPQALRLLIAYEIALSALLLTGAALTVSLAIAAGTLLVFTGWVGYLVSTGADLSCGCGGGGDSANPRAANSLALIRNIFLVGIAVLGPSKARGPLPMRRRPVEH